MMLERKITVINDVGTEVDVDVAGKVDMTALQSRDGPDWDDVREVEIRVTSAEEQ